MSGLKVEWATGTVQPIGEMGPEFARLGGYFPVVRLEALREQLERIRFLDGYNGCHMHHEARGIVTQLLSALKDKP